MFAPVKGIVVLFGDVLLLQITFDPRDQFVQLDEGHVVLHSGPARTL
jgi:hypothetical protein